MLLAVRVVYTCPGERAPHVASISVPIQRGQKTIRKGININVHRSQAAVAAACPQK